MWKGGGRDGGGGRGGGGHDAVIAGEAGTVVKLELFTALFLKLKPTMGRDGSVCNRFPSSVYTVINNYNQLHKSELPLALRLRGFP